MGNRYLKALLSSSLSIVPIVAVVLLLSATPMVTLESGHYILLLLGMVILIVGLSLFQIGASQSLTKVGEYMGSNLSKQKNLFVVIIFSLALGALITCAEPSIMIVTKQVPSIPGVLLIGSIALGVGVFVVIGVIRIIYHGSLKVWYLLFYCLTFMILTLIYIVDVKSGNDPKQWVPFIFDSGGITTGSATVPFILSLGAGVAAVRGGKNSKNDSFGLVGMASIGPIMTMAILILISRSGTGETATYATLESNVLLMFIKTIIPINGHIGTMAEVLIALLPIMVIFMIYNAIYIKLSKQSILKLFIGFLYTYIGLVLFLGAAGTAMTPIGYLVGTQMGSQAKWVIIIFAFVIGLVTILCEPAVHVLTTQIEEISDGSIKKITVLVTLSLGVGIAIALAVIRTLFQFSIMWYMIPGYMITLLLMFKCPDIFTAMAFDSGGTASGPMSSSFVLPLVVGIATTALPASEYNMYEDAFGLVALIALTPIIAIQLLGVAQTIKVDRANYIMRHQQFSADDAQIIHFN